MTISDTPSSGAAPLISVVVPVWNVADQVGAAIASLKAQTLSDFEAIVVDDGSTDGSGDSAARAIAGDPRFVLIRQENRGLSGARNTGLARARGQFLAFLDGDDAYAPRFLETLHDLLETEGLDWAACAIALWFPDGAQVPHPAIHACPEGAEAMSVPMDTATEVARHFPSAWNKLYRRSFFGDLTYPVGVWFEDHEVFWALAAQRRPMGYCPDPLYLHRRDRPGQITAADDDRVFDLIGVLERLHAALLRGGWSDAPMAFERLATRLVHERAMVVRTPARRVRFLAAINALFRRLDCHYAPDWDPEISRGLARALAGEVPLTVVLLSGDADERARQTDALGQQGMADFEVLTPGPRDARTIAEAAQGRYVLFLGPGETPAREGVMRLVNLIDQTGTPMAFGGVERETRGYHDGWTDNRVAGTDLSALPLTGATVPLGPAQALRLYPALANHIVTRAHLRALGPLPVAGDAAAMQGLVLALALGAGTAGYTHLAVAQAPDAPRLLPRPGALARWAATLSLPGEGALPHGWRGTLFWRLAGLSRPKQGGGTGHWLRALAVALPRDLCRGEGAARPDPDLPRLVRAVLPR